MGYFIDNPNRGNFINSSRSDAPLTSEKFFGSPFNNFFPKFYELIPARVVSVDYTNGVGRISVDKLVQDDGDDIVDAYPINTFIKKFPKKGDTVILLEYKLDVDNKESQTILSKIISIIKNIIVSNKNVIYYYIDVLNTDFSPSSYKNLYPIAGDVIFQGRHGQSIRFSSSIKTGQIFNGNFFNPSLFGSNSPNATVTQRETLKNTWMYGNSSEKPLIIISNGRSLNTDSNDTVEDINLDDSSIYLTSDNNIPLNINQLESSFFNSKTSNNSPIANKFNGKQIITISDNLIFKSRKNTLLYSNQNIGINATNSIVLTSGGNIVLEPMNGNRIYLGKSAVQDGEPAVKSKELETILLDLITSLLKDFVMHTDPSPTLELERLKKALTDGKIRSKNTFIL